MINHSANIDKFKGQLYSSRSGLDKQALEKLNEGLERLITRSIDMGIEQPNFVVVEARIYLAHSIFQKSKADLVSLNEEYKILSDITNYMSIGEETLVIPRFIDPVDIETGFTETVTTNVKALVDNDLSMISSCNVLVYDFRNNQYSAGALMELFYASNVLKIPTIVIMAEGQFYDESLSPWIRNHATYLTVELKETADIIQTLLSREFVYNIPDTI
ncbi:hypothetical protein [Ewingella americana]|uniref:Uncharacterized protein n=1 Tax=Ewingella americana TaxID=41202 RepID=A0A502GG82_9GAMM|nr:hypothetical protein [Ewingella americana]TPG60006.1 hypothetical protein EAH77_15680 [Ewingella americana]